MIFGWIAGTVILIVLVLIGSEMYRSKSRLAAQVQEQRLQIKHQRDQIAQLNLMVKQKVLQVRMNPHFIFNSLNAIQYFIHADDKATSLRYIGRFAAFLRKMLAMGDELSINMIDEAELIKDYLLLEQYRFPERFDYEVDLPEELCYEDIPPFLTHNLLEDALYRGVLHLGKEEKGKISVSLKAMGEGVLLEVTDNGVSSDLVHDERSEIFSRRIRLYNEQHQRKIQLTARTPVMEEGKLLNRAVITIT